MAVDSGERLNGNRIWLDRTLIDRFDISFLYREIPDEAIWFKFCYYECNVGISHDLNGISGGGELAFTVCRLSIALDFHRTFRILEKEYGNESAIVSKSEVKAPVTADPVTVPGKYGVDIKHLVQIMCFYGLATYLVIIVSFNLPFLMKEYKFTSGNSGLMISLFFLAIMAPGFILNQIVDLFKQKTKFVSLLAIALGMALILISRTEWLIGLGCIFIGFGYGVIQPIAYDKTTRTAIPEKVTLALAFVMAMNYLAILLCPFIIDFFQSMFHVKSQQFAFIFNLCIALVATIWAYVKRDSFLFNDKI